MIKKSSLILIITWLILYSSQIFAIHFPDEFSKNPNVNPKALSVNPGAIPFNQKVPFINIFPFDNISASITDDVPEETLDIVPIPICVGSVSNLSNLTDSDIANFTEISMTGTDCLAELSVIDDNDTYNAGTYAGFRVGTAGLLQASPGAAVTIRTYNNGTLQETYNAVTSSLGVDTSLISEDGTVYLGFITTSNFDEIRIEYDALLGVLFSAQVYNAVIEEFVAGPELVCNEKTMLNNPDYPLVINGDNTGIAGLLCAACSVTNTENLITTNDADFATINFTVGVATTGSVSVEDIISTYTSGSFAGYEIANTAILDVDLLDNLTITTYLDGAQQEQKSGTTGLVSATLNLLPGDGKRTVGFITSLDFDQVQLTLANLVSADLGPTKVYGLVVERYCQVDLTCDSTLILNNGASGFPVIINEFETGIGGLLCALCDVVNSQNVITPSTADYGEIQITAGVSATGTIAVLDVLDTFPIGSVAGFAIEIEDPLLGIDLNLINNSIQICTYLDGVQQECNNSSSLLNLSAPLLDIFGNTAGRFNVGFQTTKEYNEIRITVADLGLSVSLSTAVRVYSAFVDTSTADGTGANGLLCTCLDPGTAGTLTICEGETVTDTELFTSLGGTPEAGGVWTPILAGAGTYTYTHAAVGECPAVSADVVVDEQPALDPGTNGTLTICEGETVTDTELFSSLGGTPEAGGVWTPTLAGAGTYTYTHAAVGECPAVSADVVVDEQPALDPGTAGSYIICNGETLNEVILFIALGGSPDENGVWTPALAGVGTYTYTHAAVGECPAVSADVVVTACPVTVDDEYTVDEDASVVLTPLDLDTDLDGDTLSIVSIGGVTLTPGTAQTIPVTNGIVEVDASGVITFTPDPDYNGLVSFPYVITDGTSEDTADELITVTPVADILADVATASEDVPVTTDVLANDSFQGVYGTDYVVSSTTTPANGTTTIEADGTITYTPNPDFNGTDTYDYTVTVTNADGSTTTETTTVTITVDPVADIVVDVATASEDVPVTTDVLANDSFQGDYATNYVVSSTTTPANGTTTINPDGTITYTPNPDFNGTDTYDYTVTVTNADGTTTTETTTVTITVDPVADITDDNDVTQINTPVTTDVLANDNFEGLNFEITAATNGTNGTTVVNIDGTITYTPNLDFKGLDTYDYTITVYNADGTITTETATVTITIASINIVKVFTEDSVIAGGVGSSFTLVVTNDGSATLSNIDIFDFVDDRLEVTNISGTSGVDSDSDVNDQTVEWIIPSLAPDAFETITVNFTVDSAVEEANGVGALNDEDNVPNSAKADAIASDDNNIIVNDEDDDSIDILVDINLTIIKTFDTNNVTQGTLQSFTIAVSNTGPSNAVDVLIKDLVHPSLEVINVSNNAVNGDCLASAGQEIDCLIDIPVTESVDFTVEYWTAPFFNNGGSPYGTEIGDDFYFVFVNGDILEGSTDNGPVLLNGVDITSDISIINSLTRNDIIFDPPGPDPAFELHLSCSDPFTGGWGQSGGPVEGVDNNWQIAFFTIGRYSPKGFLKSCGNVVNPYNVPNIAYASGEDSFGDVTVSDDAFVTIGPGITLDRLQTNSKRLTARLTNLTGDNKVIDEISAIWPNSNGNLTKVWLTNGNTSEVIWQGNDATGDAQLNSSVSGWNGGTLLTGEGILRFDFNKKVVNSGYVIRVHFTDGTFLDINVPAGSATTAKLMEDDFIITDIGGFSASPVPFKESLTIQYDFEYTSKKIEIQIYDLSGRLLRTYYDKNVSKGDTKKLDIDFELRSTQVYIIRMVTDREVISKNVISYP